MSIARFFRSIPAANVGILVTLGLAIYGFYGGPRGTAGLTPRDIFLGFLIFAVITGYQTYLNYDRAKYDPTLTIKYEEKFEKMGNERAAAARALRDLQKIRSNSEEIAAARHRGELSGIDDVLDFFETIGFLKNGDQISSEMAHHYFYHWIRRYWVLAWPYVDSYRTKPGESKAWENLQDLFSRTSEIDVAGTDRKISDEMELSEKETEEFLGDEAAMADAADGRGDKSSA